MRKLFGVVLIFFTLNSLGNTGNNNTDDDDKPGVIKGAIVDETTGQPMEYANVAVYNTKDSSLVNGGITNEKGQFEIKGINYGEYYIEANFIGFEKTNIDEVVLNENTPLFNSGNIGLAPSAVELNSVEVVADKAPVEFKLDKKIVNVSQMINAIGGTAVNVLENTPSVQVDIEGNVSLRGSSNFTVLIDGRPSVLSGSDALRQIPSSAIENIEIITNPSAKYEPDGTAGIINLVMKKNSMNGINGIVNASVGSGDKYRGDFTLNYRTNKFNFFVGADWRDETNGGGMNSFRESYSNDTTTYLDIGGDRNFIRQGHNFKSGIELFLSQQTTLSVSGELGKSGSTRNEGGKTRSYSIPASVDDYFAVTEEISDRENDFYSGRLNFQHKFNNNGHRIEAMAYYSNEEGTDSEEESEILADENFVRTDEYLDRVRTVETEDEKEFRFKLDYTYPFSEDGRFEAGLQSRIDKEIEGIQFLDYNQATDTWAENSTYSSTTDFKRGIHAAYSTFSNKLGAIQYMLGLRGELTQREILNTNATESASLNRFDLFPTLHLSYQLLETNEFMASYSRRIDRPRGWDLDPAPNYFNRYTIRFGNPQLKPEYTDSYEVGYMKRFGRSYISLDAFRRVTNNKIERYEELQENGVYYLYSDNFDKDYSTGLELTGNVNFTKWLLVNASLSMFNYRITGDINGESIDRESTNWDGRMNTTLKFSENSRMQLQGFFRGPSVSAQGESKGMIFTNVSYRHEFWDNKLSATLSVRDPLGTAKFERESYGENFKSWFEWKREPRVVMLTMSYKINNFKEERRNGGGGDGGMDMGGGEY
ncbi:outer membrane beta-barrel family protein [Maribellus maritimus]|uniref:outer membrane beta-barrel family protein n=1 Tax=Maribellus maritimus TaxID=2870838 RepID=UPI001EEC3114|nr:outer membrane beta-barrel family protein [Maribellus maritimus]MCG6188972.1 TonB-dependent receptor family protein [Maribellus maritimus]